MISEGQTQLKGTGMLSRIKQNPGLLIAVAAIYFILAYFSLQSSLSYSPISPIWLPSGFGLAALFICGSSIFPAIAIGAVAANGMVFFSSSDTLTSTIPLFISFTILDAIQPYFIYRFFLNVTHSRYPFDSDARLLAFLLGSITVVGITSSLYTLLLNFFGSTPEVSYTHLLLILILADITGILVVAPLILAHKHFPGLNYISDKLLEWTAWTIGLVIVTYLAFYQDFQSVFLLLPLAVWAATRFSQPGCMLALTISLSLGFLGMITIAPLNQDSSRLYDLIMLEVLLVVIGSTTLYVSALLEERKKASNKLEDTVLQRTQELQKANQELTDEVYVRNLAEKSFRASSRRYKALIETAGSPIIAMDSSFIIKQWNSAAEQLFGYSRDDSIGKNYISCFVSASIQDETAWKITKVIQSGVGTENLEGETIAYNGEAHTMLWNISRISNTEDEQSQVILIGQDITEIKATQDQLHHLAHFDILTGMANRRLFEDRCNQALKQCLRHQSQIAIINLDIDFFKRINDTLGHDAGDELLKEMAKRLTSCVRDEDTIARLGGDEFAILLANVNGIEGTDVVAKNILKAITAPVNLPVGELVITSSIGVTIAPNDSSHYAELLKNADMAMYRAKSAGRNNIKYYSPDMNEDIQRQLTIEQELRYAIQNNEFKLYYQPIIDIETGQIVSLETLLRWQHPTKGLIGPDDFLEVAEQTGQLLAIGEWTFQNACLQGKAVQCMSETPVQIALNVSNRQYSHPQLFPTIERILSETRFDPHTLILEIEESTITGKLDESVITLKKLKQLGLSLTIDGFGTGMSSLTHLKKLPIDIIKIDRTFIKGIPDDENDKIIAETLLNIAHKMKLKTFATGVETKEQEAFLKANGCRYVQGFLYSTPLPSESLPQLFQEVRNSSQKKSF